MLTQVNFPHEGLVAFVSLERRNVLIVRHDYVKGKDTKGEVLGAVSFTIDGIVGCHPWNVHARQILYTLPESWESRVLRANDSRESKAQRKALRKARRRDNRTNRIDEHIVETLKIAFTRQLLATC